MTNTAGWLCTWAAAALIALIAGQGCPAPGPAVSDGDRLFNNTSDKTNGGAQFVGSAACRACHPDIAAAHRLHGHAHMLTPSQGVAPEFPSEAVHAGVPSPPAGFTWNDIAYVIGGYTRKANLVDQQGYLITTGFDGVPAQWNLGFPPSATPAGFVTFEPDSPGRRPYDYACFVCHTTGPRPQDPAEPQFQDGRVGIAGTWAEPGVQCEACHGPGSRHVPYPAARDIFVDVSAAGCGECHSRGPQNIIPAADGFILNYTQYNELLASGGHASFDCTFCHNPHASKNYQAGLAIRNDCTACHAGQNMALHAGKVLVRGDYTETLTCQSCHMPYATRSASTAGMDVVGTLARVGDIRTHIFRINSNDLDFQGMFTADLQAVAKDQHGRAAVTVDFVCLRCHNDNGVFALTVSRASEIARVIHASGE